MSKKPTDPSSSSTTPANTGETHAGEKKRRETLPADTGRYEIEGSAVRFIQASAQAETALGSLSSTATASGHPDVAKVAQTVQVHFHTWNINIGTGNTINNLQSAEIDQEISQRQEYARQLEEKLEANNVEFYDCIEQRKACLAKAQNKFDIGECWGAYIGCMSIRGASVLKPFI